MARCRPFNEVVIRKGCNQLPFILDTVVELGLSLSGPRWSRRLWPNLAVEIAKLVSRCRQSASHTVRIGTLCIPTLAVGHIGTKLGRNQAQVWPRVTVNRFAHDFIHNVGATFLHGAKTERMSLDNSHLARLHSERSASWVNGVHAAYCPGFHVLARCVLLEVTSKAPEVLLLVLLGLPLPFFLDPHIVIKGEHLLGKEHLGLLELPFNSGPRRADFRILLPPPEHFVRVPSSLEDPIEFGFLLGNAPCRSQSSPAVCAFDLGLNLFRRSLQVYQCMRSFFVLPAVFALHFFVKILLLTAFLRKPGCGAGSLESSSFNFGTVGAALSVKLNL
mmetsp:Transcript_18476/g.59002  ORF Transcript_18476/g.59002 Transcript_18476/m.59002 type:complete len:332 (-) Transcript_18476:1570-2565(-)